jgi:hypothetical protein
MDLTKATIQKELKRRELWRRGEIEELLFHAGQLKIDQVYRNSPGAVVVFLISRQWGKTFFGVTKAVALALKKPKSRIRIAAAFETDLGEFVEPAFEAVLETCPAELAPKYVQQKRRYIFPNGSVIKLVGLDRKPNGLRGNAIDLIILDEAGFIARLDYIHTSVIVPLTTHRPDAKILLTSTPPESPDHEFWDFVDRAKLDNSYAEFTIDQCPIVTPKDVTRLEREMGGRDTTAFRREYLCEKVVESERAVIPEFDARIHVADCPRPEYWRHLHCYDFLDTGVRDFTFCGLGYYDFPNARLVVEDEIALSGSAVTTRNIADQTKRKERDLGYIPYRRISDNNNLILINDLSIEEKLPFAPTDKDSLEAMVNALRGWFRDKRIVVHPRCQFLIGTLGSALWNKNRDDFARSKTFGHADAIAALMYGVRNIDVHTNPVPANYENPWLNARKPKLTETGRDLKAAFSRRG